MPLDESTERRIRNQIPDTDAVFGPNEDEYIFESENLEDFYADAVETHPNGNPAANILRAAAFANLALATSEGLISKKIKTQDLQTDASWVSELRQKAAALFDRADAVDARAALDYFEIVDYGEGWSAERPELTEYTYRYGF